MMDRRSLHAKADAAFEEWDQANEWCRELKDALFNLYHQIGEIDGRMSDLGEPALTAAEVVAELEAIRTAINEATDKAMPSLQAMGNDPIGGDYTRLPDRSPEESKEALKGHRVTSRVCFYFRALNTFVPKAYAYAFSKLCNGRDYFNSAVVGQTFHQKRVG